jgi:hypothetical protein
MVVVCHLRIEGLMQLSISSKLNRKLSFTIFFGLFERKVFAQKNKYVKLPIALGKTSNLKY